MGVALATCIEHNSPRTKENHQNFPTLFFLDPDAASLHHSPPIPQPAGVAELVDALGSGPSVRKDVRVQVPPSAPKVMKHQTKQS